jgi:hypothetical protein
MRIDDRRAPTPVSPWFEKPCGNVLAVEARVPYECPVDELVGR